VARADLGRAGVATVALSAAACAASGALAHGPAGGTGYISTFVALQPNVVGVSVRVLGGDDRIQLVNYSGKRILVLGYQNEPFISFDATGVYENVRSPSTYVSRSRNGVAPVPPSADAKADPRWVRVSQGSSFAWHDHRIHWMGVQPPPAVRKAPKDEHRIFDWRVPASADGERFVIAGFLGYRPRPGGSGDGGLPTWALVLVPTLGAVALLGVALGARRLRQRAPS
jgi:hypothetical protein